MSVFYLKNRDVNVLKFSIETIRNDFVNYNLLSIIRKNLIPLNMKDLPSWVSGRYLMGYRGELKVFFNMLGVCRMEDFVSITHCISLCDTYWVCLEDSSISWKSVSPYTNPLNKVIADYAFERKINGKCITGSPDFSTDGTFPKCWKRKNGKLYLLKAGSSGARNAGLEPYSEVYASRVSELLGLVFYTKYSLSSHKGILVSECECITSERFGMISYKDIAKGTSLRDFLNDNRFEPTSKIDMLLLDYLTCNVDRHYGNIGVLVENEYNMVMNLAPIFDNNLSCLPYYTVDENLEYYINDIRAKDGSTWEELYRMIDCKYTRERMNLFIRRYKYISVCSKRDSIVNKMLKIQISRYKSIVGR